MIVPASLPGREKACRKRDKKRGLNKRCRNKLWYLEVPSTQAFFWCTFRHHKPVRKQLPTIFLWNNMWGTSSEIPYWWRITTQIWVVFLIGWKFASTNEKHFPDLGSAYDISMEFLSSFVRRHFVGKPVVASRNVNCSVSGKGEISCRHILWNRRFQTDGNQAFVLATDGTSVDDGALIKQLAWPMAERQIGYRKSRLVFPSSTDVPVLLLNQLTFKRAKRVFFWRWSSIVWKGWGRQLLR